MPGAHHLPVSRLVVSLRRLAGRRCRRARAFPDLDLREYGLEPVRMQVVLGFVFVCLAGKPPPLEQMWAPFAGGVRAASVRGHGPARPLYLEHWDVDWKIAMDNYLESYHVPIGHPGLNRMFTPDYEDQVNVPAALPAASAGCASAPSSHWSERMYQRHVGRGDAQHLPEPQRRSWSFYSCCRISASTSFPSRWISSRCCRADRASALIRGAAFALPDERREMRIVRWLGNRINRQVSAEDEFLCRRVQRGLASQQLSSPGPLSRIENCMLEFHDLLRERIPEVRSAGAAGALRLEPAA